MELEPHAPPLFMENPIKIFHFVFGLPPLVCIIMTYVLSCGDIRVSHHNMFFLK